MEIEEIQRNEEAIRNYIIGVAFGGLEGTRRYYEKAEAQRLEWAADRRAPTAGPRGPEPK